ncbi:MAG: polysaccharide biosynthesis protein [Thiobacillus sp.]|nr:polysaccharide biosynthesis protein [Thiobacillus sp.]
MKLNPRTVLVFGHDIVAAGLAWMVAYALRFNLDIPHEYLRDAQITVGWVVILQTFFFWRFGLYRGLWRFASLPDLKRILLAVGMAAVATPAMLFLTRIEAVVPRSVLFLDPLLLLLIMGGSRLAYRAWKEHRLASLLVSDTIPIIVAGAGSEADTLLRDLSRSGAHWRVVGLLDEDVGNIGRQVQGIPVLGGLAELPHRAKTLDVRDVVLALPSHQIALRRQLVEICTAAGLRVLTAPALEDVMDGRVAVSQLRPIELDDLLGRVPVTLDDAGLADFLGGQVVLVSGAGGSIGSELCRQIARFHPARLVFMENSELALYRIEQEFHRLHPDLSIACIVGDVKDAARVADVLSEHRPTAIFHAAAYKHVPLMECDNAWQAVRNNIFGTYVLANEALRHGVAKFVLISTDKAVNPTNVMGASKRAAEMVCQWLHGRGSTRFISVRFGNVLGSSGSVVPKFREQIEAGGPVTVTHPDITRYFMTIPEASQLVLQAGLMGNGGEIFVLDMGDPVRIADLARLMIRLAGKTEAEIGIDYVGLRPGEKLYEELLADSETTLPTPHPKLRVAKARAIDPDLVADALEWLENSGCVTEADVKLRLKRYVAEYRDTRAG